MTEPLREESCGIGTTPVVSGAVATFPIDHVQIPEAVKKAEVLSLRPYMIIKRILDVIASFVLLVPASMIVGICYIAIKAETKGPAFFVQERPGYQERIFRMIKLRTMILETERDGRMLTDMERMTKAGRVFRAFSLDELPQIWNILKGEMSLIGPRPLCTQYLSYYSPEESRRHLVKPGITGMAQVHGRNATTWEERFRWDLYYVDHFSLSLDIKILLLSALKVIKRENVGLRGISAPEDFDVYRNRQINGAQQ